MDIVPISTAVVVAAPPLPDVDLLAGRLAASSLAVYRRDMAAYVAWCAGVGLPPAAATSLAAWRTHMAQQTTKSPKTINRMLAAVKRIMKEAAAQGHISAERAAQFSQVEGVSERALKSRLKKNNKTRITPEDMRRICDSPDPERDGRFLAARNRALLLTMATSGCRVSEVCGLRWEDVEQVEDGYIISVRGKTDVEPRAALLSDEAVAAIKAWHEVRGWSDGPIFTSSRARGKVLTRDPITTTAAWLVVQAAAAACGLKWIKPHDFRRFLVTQAIVLYGIEEARQLAGHKSIETTSHYNLNGLRAGRTNKLF